jgi:hypothetical protein
MEDDMWDKEKIAIYTQFLTAQEHAVLEALSAGIDSLDNVKSFVTMKLDGDVDQDYITAVWTQNMEPYEALEDLI